MSDNSTIEVARIASSRVCLHPEERDSIILSLETSLDTRHYLIRASELRRIGEQFLSIADLLDGGERVVGSA